MSFARIFNSAVDTMQQSAKNIQAIRDARKKRERDDQLFDLNKKKAEMGLKESELKGESTSIQNQTQRALMNEYFKQQGMINDGKNAEIDQVEHQQMAQGEQAHNVAKSIYQSDPMVQSMVAQRINPRLATVPGPNGGMVQGQDATMDNSPDAVPSAFSGVPDNPLKPSLTAKGFTFKSQKQNEFIANKIEKQKASGVPLLPEEQYFDYRNTLQKQGIKYNRGAVLKQAKDLAKAEQGDKFVTPKQIADMIPEAENSLYGLSLQDHVGGDNQDQQGSTVDQNSDESLATTDKTTDLGKIDQYTVGEMRDVPGKGKYKYLGKNKWQKT